MGVAPPWEEKQALKSILTARRKCFLGKERQLELPLMLRYLALQKIEHNDNAS